MVIQWPGDSASIKTGGSARQVKIVCFDDEPETLAAIKEGSIFGTVAQQPFEYGYQAVLGSGQNPERRPVGGPG